MGNKLGSEVRPSQECLKATFIGALPKELFVENAGSAEVNGKYLFREGPSGFPKTKNIANLRTVWYVNENGGGCWMGFGDTTKNGLPPDWTKWMIFNANGVLYAAHTGSRVASPRKGRWELAPWAPQEGYGDGGKAPPPTVNLQPLPACFQLTGWSGHKAHLNGIYSPLDNCASLNGRYVFEHRALFGAGDGSAGCHATCPVLSIVKAYDSSVPRPGESRCQMYWAKGAWYIDYNFQLNQGDDAGQKGDANDDAVGDEDGADEDNVDEDNDTGDKEHDPDQHYGHQRKAQCTAFVTSEASYPTDIAVGATWYQRKSSNNGEAVAPEIYHDAQTDLEASYFEPVKGVCATATVEVRIFVVTPTGDPSSPTAINVRLWTDDVASLEDKVFVADTPRQRQRIWFAGSRLQDDGRVLAQYGLVAECTVHLVISGRKGPLDALFAEPKAVDVQVVGGTVPETSNTGLHAYYGGVVVPSDGCIYLPPWGAAKALCFDPVAKTWDAFGDVFASALKWSGAAISSSNNLIYSMPFSLHVVNRVLEIDPVKKTTRQVGPDIRTVAKEPNLVWHGTVATPDGFVFGIPHAPNTPVLRFDPRTGAMTCLAMPEDSGRYLTGIVGPSGRFIFCPPFAARRVLCIDTQALTTTLIGQVLDADASEDTNWMGGGIGGDGCIYCIPLNASRVLRIDPVTRTTSFFGPKVAQNVKSWGGGCAAADGCVYGTPRNADRALRVNPFAGTVSTVGVAIPSELRSKLGHAVLGPGGGVWLLPMSLPARMVRLEPPPSDGALLTSLLPPAQHAVLQEGLSNPRCCGSTLAHALWWEAKRVGGDAELVCRLLQAAAPSVLKAVLASIRDDHGRTANILLQTLLVAKSSQVDDHAGPSLSDYYLNSASGSWDWHEASAHQMGMNLASVSSKEEYRRILEVIGDSQVWLGARRKTSSQQPRDSGKKCTRYRGDNDWEWSDGTPWSFTRWSRRQPDNGEGIQTRAWIWKCTSSDDQTCRGWDDIGPNQARLPGIYRKPRSLPALKALCAIATNHDALQQCFLSDKLRITLVRAFDLVLRFETSITVAAVKQGNISQHLQREWPIVAKAFQVVRCAPTVFPTADERISFLSYLAESAAILHAPFPNTWQPLPATVDDWSWPPAPLRPLRAACKLVENIGPEAVHAAWPALATAIAVILVRMIEAVRADLEYAKRLLNAVFDRERKASLGTYQKQLRRARRDPNFPEFKLTANGLQKELQTRQRKEKFRKQSTALFPTLRADAQVLYKRFSDFLAMLSEKCVGATRLVPPLKGCGRALEKLVLHPGIAAKFKAEGVDALDATRLSDVLRGSLECPDFTEIVFVLEMLQLLDVDMGDEEKAEAAGWDIKKFQIRISHIKDRFSHPTSGGWADALVNFSFVHGDDKHHVMELQLQHVQMLVVRKEGKAHNVYNSFRSAYELLEAVGHAPSDSFEETDQDLPPLQMLEKRMRREMQVMQQQMREQMQQQMRGMQQKIDQLTSRLEKLEGLTTND